MYVRTLLWGSNMGWSLGPWGQINKNRGKTKLDYILDLTNNRQCTFLSMSEPFHLSSHLSCVRCPISAVWDANLKQNFPSHRHIAKRGKQVLGWWTSRRAVCRWFAGGRRRLWLRRRCRRRRWWRRGRLGRWLLQLPLPLNQGHWLRQRGKSRDHLLLFDPLLEVAVAKVSCRLWRRHLGWSYGADNESDAEIVTISPFLHGNTVGLTVRSKRWQIVY